MTARTGLDEASGESSRMRTGFFGPATKRAAEAEEGGARVIDPVFRWAPLVYIALFGFTIWSMVTKLGV
ncbi:MAG: hypothetical protein WD156_02510 [Acidimicrobiia bacterium]